MQKLTILIIFLIFWLFGISKADQLPLFHVSFFHYENGENIVVQAAIYADMNVRLSSKKKLLATSLLLEKKTYTEIINYWENKKKTDVIKVNLSDHRSRRRDPLFWRGFIQMCISTTEDKVSAVEKSDIEEIPSE